MNRMNVHLMVRLYIKLKHCYNDENKCKKYIICLTFAKKTFCQIIGRKELVADKAKEMKSYYAVIKEEGVTTYY